jgi:hypothetical protein
LRYILYHDAQDSYARTHDAIFGKMENDGSGRYRKKGCTVTGQEVLGKHYRFFSQLEALYGETIIDAACSCLGITTRTNVTESLADLDFNGDGATQKCANTHNSEAFSLSSDSSLDDEYSHDMKERSISFGSWKQLWQCAIIWTMSCYMQTHSTVTVWLLLFHPVKL